MTKTGQVDLHTHSTASDGTTPPKDVGASAKTAGLSAIALTDHDTTDGLVEAAQSCQSAGVEFVPGIELSAELAVVKPLHDPPRPTDGRGTLHLLGLFIRHDDAMLGEIQQEMAIARRQRLELIVAKLQELGVRIEAADVTDLAKRLGTQAIGRPHIGQVLVDKGYAKSIQDAFRRYIGHGGAAYVRRDRLAPKRAIQAIHHAGGLAILAHPIQLHCADAHELEHAVVQLKKMGLDALEAIHSDHAPADVQRYRALAQKHQLLISGGSDFHGTRKPIALGSQQVDRSVYDALKDALDRQRAL